MKIVSAMNTTRTRWKFDNLVVLVLVVAGGTVYAVETPENQSTKKSEEVDPGPVTKRLVSLFEAREFFWKPEADQEQRFNYRLFRPAGRVKGSKFPMIVWLHGHGAFEMENINIGQLLYVEQCVIRDPSHPEKYPFFVLAVQCTVDNDRWFVRDDKNTAGGERRMTPGEVTLRIIPDLLKSEAVDPDRIYLSGICAGATGSLEMAALRPDLFAAIGCFSAAGIEAASLKKLVDIPVWAFRNPADSPEGIRLAIRTLNEFGGRCAFTETKWGGHDSWSEAFANYDVLDWLMSQRRGRPDKNLPGTPPLRIRWQQFKSDYRRYLQWEQWRPRLVTIGVVAVIIGLCRREFRRHGSEKCKVSV
jgi:predicted peptidase